MRTKGIAGEEYFILNEIGEHGIGPMQKRDNHKLQGATTEIKLLTVFNGARVDRLIDLLLQKLFT